VKPISSAIADADIQVVDIANDLHRHLSQDATGKPGVIYAHIAWVVLFLLGPLHCDATVVLSACSADRVVVAADGLSIAPVGNTPTSATCKIRQASDDCFFAVIGLKDFNGKNNGVPVSFDVPQMAAKACKGSGTIKERAISFQESSLPKVRSALKLIKERAPDFYAMLTPPGKPWSLYVVFAGGTPLTVAYVGYIEDANGNVIADVPGRHICAPRIVDNPEYYTIGQTDNVLAFWNNPPDAGGPDAPEFLRRQIQNAIRLEQIPPRIGPPIAVLAIDRYGPKWIQQGACPDIKTQSNPKPNSSKSNSHP